MIGISDMALALPKCYLSLEEFSIEKGLNYAKLRGGLGLINMAIPDLDEDIITLTAEAMIKILDNNPQIGPHNLKRIYVGTESQIDGSKPIASYLIGICNQYFNSKGLSDLEECDASDTIFACIGAVDAMHNSLFWLKENKDDFAIIIASDIAKYEFDSSGEYTQGAGAVAVLLSSEPNILTIDTKFGVSSKCAHDFFKPLRYSKVENSDTDGNGQEGHSDYVLLHSDCPVFDGPVSMKSYKERIHAAYDSFKRKHPEFSITDWEKMVFHLPFAFQARKIATPFFLHYLNCHSSKEQFFQKYQISDDLSDPSVDKQIRSTSEFNEFIIDKISNGEVASSQVGNIYTGSIFMSLMSMLYYSSEQNEDLTDKSIGFVAYGSGAKSKVFQAKISKNWKQKTKGFKLNELFQNRTQIDFSSYKQLYFQKQNKNCSQKEQKVKLTQVGITEHNYGERIYKYNSNA